MKNIKKYPISKLSFIILTDNYTEEEKKEAKEEIERRFSKNGCDYEEFMEYERNAISRRGQDINNYLIQDNPDGQLLIELYLKYVYNKELYEHGNLLFSENLLCNSNSEHSFFTKAIKVELENIKYRLNKGKYDEKDIEKMNMIYTILDNRYEKENGNIWYEDSLTDCVMDIVTEDSSLITKEMHKDYEKILKEVKKGKIKAKLKNLYYKLLSDNELLNYLNMRHIVNKELIRLNPQRKSIASSICKHTTIDYSFVDKKKLIKKKL